MKPCCGYPRDCKRGALPQDRGTEQSSKESWEAHMGGVKGEGGVREVHWGVVGEGTMKVVLGGRTRLEDTSQPLADHQGEPP